VLVLAGQSQHFLDDLLGVPPSVPSLQGKHLASGADGLVDESSAHHEIMKQIVCFAAVLLWVVTVVAAGWLFVNGWTQKGSDARIEIILAPVERDQILAEMRQLLKAVDGIVRGLGASTIDRAAVETAARSVGMHMAADVEPEIMAKLPLPFKQLGMSIHKDMDALADAILREETPQQILQRLSTITARCTACHDMYRLGVSD
jgi:cytochrome c556